MSLIKKLADITSQESKSHKMRFQRFNLFMDFIGKLGRPIRILDVGGNQEYWASMGLDSADIKITLLNLSKQPVSSPNFESVVGDATNLGEYADKSFDVVFSNSVIEHLYTEENQQKMADEVKRVGRFFFIQTPNYYFPLEPHFLFPGFQYLPLGLRVSLIHRFNLGHIARRRDINEARRQVKEIRLLTINEMKKLFPGVKIWEEKFFGLTKSMVAHNFD